MVSSVVQSYEIGREASRQAKEDAYTAARRPIVNAYADRAAQQQLASGEQTINLRDSAESRANAGEARAAQDQDNGQTDRQFKMAAQFTDALSQQLAAAPPGTKPSDLLKSVPPEVLKAIQLDTPEAQAHFAQVYDADPTQLTAHSQMYGSPGQKVVKQEAAKDKDGVEGFLITFDNGKTHFVPGYAKTATGAQGAYTVGGIRHAADGSIITDDSDALAALAGAKAQTTTVGKAQGTNQAEDIAPSAAATRAAANAHLDLRQQDAAFQRAGSDAAKLVGALSTGYAANLNAPGTPAYQLNAALDTMKAQLTLGSLLDLKAKSKNGGSGLGALSDKEGELLAAIQGSLKAGQDPATLKATIAQLQQVHAQRLKAQEAAFLETYGVTPEAGLKVGGRAPAAAAGGDDLADLRAKYGAK